MDKLQIVQWNALSAFSNHNVLNNLCADTLFCIVLILETWDKPGLNNKISVYNMIQNGIEHGEGGVVIIMGKTIDFSCSNSDQNLM